MAIKDFDPIRDILKKAFPNEGGPRQIIGRPFWFVYQDDKDRTAGFGGTITAFDMTDGEVVLFISNPCIVSGNHRIRFISKMCDDSGKWKVWTNPFKDISGELALLG